MRIAVLTHYYPPEPGAPQVRLHALASGLAAAGAQVTVHTCAPHYPEGAVSHGYRNRVASRAYDGGGARIVRSLVLPAANRGIGRRLLDHASFAASALATGPLVGPADVVIAESPPLFLAAAAPLYARLRGAALVLHVSDLWPDSVVQLGAVTDRRAIAAARALERHAYRRSRAIVTPTAGIARRLEERPEAAGKVVRIPPAVDVDRFAAPPVERDGPLRALYAGTVGMAQGVGTLVEAAGRAGGETVRVTVAGAGAELDDVRRACAEIENADCLGAVEAEAVPALYARSDVAVVLLRDRRLFRGALPTKLFEAMASGRPVVLAAPEGEAAELVRDSRAGVVVAPEAPDALAAALSDLAARPAADLRELGAHALAAARRHDRPRMLEAWWRPLGQCLGGRSSYRRCGSTITVPLAERSNEEWYR